ncbi:ABC transporter permease [Falsiroseomonas sp.]|uniref:ABC transporter permease n=1 Tax=Falsiroseomonas sp. TaxID=2870721 RepID=UPI003F72BD15
MSAVIEAARAAPLPRPQPAPRRRRRRAIGAVLVPLGFALFVLALWEAVVRIAALPPYILPAPSNFIAVLVARHAPILQMAAQTAKATLLGFAIGVSVGLVLGGVIGSSRAIYRTVYPALIGFHTIPSVALIPLFVVWFGAGPHIAVLTAVVVCFFPVTVIVATAISTSAPELDDVLRSLGATRSDVLFKVAFPRAMPQFFGSIKLAITGAFIGTIVAETIAANSGIGYVMVVATNSMDGALAFAALSVLALMGVTLYALSLLIEKRLTGWAYRGR